jgi:predicted AlkP superfamily pyrophosphatase or phosphodiesterase
VVNVKQRTNRRLRWIRLLTGGGAVAVTVLLSGAASQPEPVQPGAVSDHVIVISMDGMRPDALMEYGAETVQRLMREGTFATEARTIFPSKTLPSHTSMVTGVPPEIHGITWNEDETDTHGKVDVQTMFEVAKAQGYHTAAFFSKSKFHHLQKEGTLDYTQAPNGMDKWMATRTVGDVANYLKHERPNLLFVHIAEADYAGHSIGWMSFGYKWAVGQIDRAIGQVLKSADAAYGEGNYTVIVTADHGGHDRNHGEDVDSDMLIPWIVWGKGVNNGTQVPAVKTMDTAATALWLLGLDEPQTWVGKAVASAFTPQAQLAATEMIAKRAAAAE